MAEICCGVVSESEATTPGAPSSRVARRKRMEIRRFKFVTGVVPSETEENERPKRQKLKLYPTSSSRDSENAVRNCVSDGEDKVKVENGRSKTREMLLPHEYFTTLPLTTTKNDSPDTKSSPNYGVASICGRRRDMEDAVAVHPSFLRLNYETTTDEMHYFGVYDGHGCSHVAMRCRERLHELVKEELEIKNNDNNSAETTEWKGALERGFVRMDKEVCAFTGGVVKAACRCDLQTPECDAVGSTAVVAIVTHDKIIVANCGDSRAVLCRNGKAIPLSSDHKPDRPDELNRIEEAGGRVIYWDGPRVLGVLAMSRAIGDNYLKPYVSCEPEVTIMDRTAEDDCLILATDGLWDVVSNETACGVARMCLRGKCLAPAAAAAATRSCMPDVEPNGNSNNNSNKCCSDASLLLTKLALARHSSDNVSVVVVDLREVAT